jgi:hypothetical protein
VPATECPRISAEFLADERAALPDSWFRQKNLAARLRRLAELVLVNELVKLPAAFERGRF